MEPLHYEIVKGGVNRHLSLSKRRLRRGTHFSVLCFNEEGRVVGTMEFGRSGRGRGRTHTAYGTYVDGGYQGRGIATTLWQLALGHSHRPAVVSVQVVTDRGMTLAKSLEAKFPDFEWDIWQWSQRKLRELERKRKVPGHGPSTHRTYFHPGCD